jgi:hypothetical protein
MTMTMSILAILIPAMFLLTMAGTFLEIRSEGQNDKISRKRRAVF